MINSRESTQDERNAPTRTGMHNIESRVHKVWTAHMHTDVVSHPGLVSICWARLAIRKLSCRKNGEKGILFPSAPQSFPTC